MILILGYNKQIEKGQMIDMETLILVVSILILLVAIVIAVKVFSVKQDEKSAEINNNLIRLIEQNQNYNAQLTQQINAFSDTMRNNFGTLENSIRIINEKLFAETNLLINKLTEDTRNQLNKLTEDTRNQLDKMAFETRNQLDKNASDDNQKLNKLNEDMLRSSKQTDEQIKEINKIVSEKMQDILTQKFNDAFETIVKNMSELSKSINDGQEKQKEEIKYQLGAIKEEFAKIHVENKETMDRIREDNQKSLDKINETVNEKLQKSINDRINQSFEAVNNRLSEVYKGLGEMKEVASGVKDLKNVLSNVKTRGILGEIQLSAILEEILTKEQYEEQFKLTPNSRDLVDFAIKLPGQEDGKYVYLPIDSKFPGGRWSDLAEAYESGDSALVKERRKTLEAEIKTCARSIRDKYIKPPYTTDFAIMFLPFEGLYSEVVNMGLVEVLQREYKVNITGPSTMAATLNSLQMGFRTLAIQKKSGEVWSILEAAKKEFANFADVLESARKRLRQADEELNTLIGTRTNAINRKLRDVTVLDNAVEAREILEIETANEL